MPTNRSACLPFPAAARAQTGGTSSPSQEYRQVWSSSPFPSAVWHTVDHDAAAVRGGGGGGGGGGEGLARGVFVAVCASVRPRGNELGRGKPGKPDRITCEGASDASCMAGAWGSGGSGGSGGCRGSGGSEGDAGSGERVSQPVHPGFDGRGWAEHDCRCQGSNARGRQEGVSAAGSG